MTATATHSPENESDEPGRAVLRDAVVQGSEVYRESLPVLLASTAGGLVAGTVLGGEGMRHAFETIPGLFLMLPAIMAMRGNIFGAMGARIATALHQGLIEPEFTRQDRLETAITVTMVNGVTMSVFIAVSSRILLHLLGMPSASVFMLLGVTLIASLLSAVVMTAILVSLLFIGFRRNMDPNILNGPIVTTSGDIFEVLFIYVAVMIVGVVL